MAITFQFRGVTPTGDAYEPRNSDSPDALQYGMQAARWAGPSAAACGGTATAIWCPTSCCIDKITGQHLAQWNVY